MKIILSGVPQSTNNIYKHTYRNGKLNVYMNESAKALKESYQWEAKSQWRRPVFEGTMKIAIYLYFPDHKIVDWDNFHKLSMDALTGIVWKDDSQIMAAMVVKKKDKENPRIEIIIN